LEVEPGAERRSYIDLITAGGAVKGEIEVGFSFWLFVRCLQLFWQQFFDKWFVTPEAAPDLLE